MTKVEVIRLNDARVPGQRKMPYKSIVLMAETLNKSNYILPGPKGYLSPSTMAEWQMCPHAVYQKQILKSCPKTPDLAAVFGNAQHEATASGFEEYRDTGTMTCSRLTEIIRNWVAQELLKMIPKEVWAEPNAFLKNITDAGLRKYCEGAFLSVSDMAPVSLVEAKSMILAAPELTNRFRELAKKSVIEFLEDVGKRMDGAESLFSAYCELEDYKRICMPSEIQAIEEDMFVVIDGIPVYFVADLVTERGVFDHKFTSASAISRRWEKIPTDIQLWIYELVFERPSSLLLYAPPAKTSKAKPRDLVVRLDRRAEGHRVLEDQYFLDLITEIPEYIDNGRFPKKGKCFMGDCGACDAYEVCTMNAQEAPRLTVNSIGSLVRKTAEKLDLGKIKAEIIAEAEKDTGISADSFEEE